MARGKEHQSVVHERGGSNGKGNGGGRIADDVFRGVTNVNESGEVRVEFLKASKLLRFHEEDS